MYGEGDPERGGRNHRGIGFLQYVPGRSAAGRGKLSCLTRSGVVQGYLRLVNGKLRPTSKQYEPALNAVKEEKSDPLEEKPHEASFRFVDSGNFIVDYGQVSILPFHRTT